ncbi:MAG: hypothetical protein MZV64_64115 [Ignavibacteriales bacterium]|nr:hypothetical protein [Ignavibacteriales bacterium]
MKRIPPLAAARRSSLAGLVPAAAQDTPPRPAPSAPDVLRAIVNEASGELALQNEIHLTGVNRNRKAEEYRNGYFESAFILEKLREYGLDGLPPPSTCPSRAGRPGTRNRPSCGPSSRSWRKIADLDDVPASLCSGSATTDTTAELVYVGPGNREEFYKDKDVEGKILLVNGPPERARRLGVAEVRRGGPRRLVLEPSRVRPGRGRLERPAPRAGRTGRPSASWSPQRQGQEPPGRPGARPQDRRPGRGQDPGRSRTTRTS